MNISVVTDTLQYRFGLANIKDFFVINPGCTLFATGKKLCLNETRSKELCRQWANFPNLCHND